jgi:hypothetical protein
MGALSPVPRLLAHGYFLASATIRLSVLFIRASRYFKKNGLRDLELAPEQQVRYSAKRHRHYFLGAVFLGAVFGRKRGRALDRAELRRFSNLAALACFFDDLTDGVRGSSALFDGSLTTIEAFARVADPSGMALHLLEKTRATLPRGNAEPFHDALRRVFQLEVANRQQQLPPPSPDEIARLTAEKGGYSVMLFRCLLAEPITAPEWETVLAFGCLVQLSDDIFDLWHDRQNETATVATFFAAQNDVEQLAAFFEQQVAAVSRAIRQTTIPSVQQETALRTVHFLVSITRVCLRHYHVLRKKHGTLPLHDRRAMVVDMARWHMRLQAVQNVTLQPETL